MLRFIKRLFCKHEYRWQVKNDGDYCCISCRKYLYRCPKCGGWIYLENDSNGYCDTCDTCVVEGELIVEGGDNDERIQSTDASEGD